MHSLEVIEARNVKQVYKEVRDALVREDLDTVSRIARANPDLFTFDGRVK